MFSCLGYWFKAVLSFLAFKSDLQRTLIYIVKSEPQMFLTCNIC